MASGYYILDSTDTEDNMPEKDEYRNFHCLYLETLLIVKSISMSICLLVLASITPNNISLHRDLSKTNFLYLNSSLCVSMEKK